MDTVKDLNDLAFEHNYVRLQTAVREYPLKKHEEYVKMNRELSCAYWELTTNKNAGAAVAHLNNVQAICQEKLSPDYLEKYNRSIMQLEAHISKHGNFVSVEMDLQKMLSRMQSL